MKKLIWILLFCISLFSCNKRYKEALITHGDTVKTVEVKWGNPEMRDTLFTAPASMDDSIILKNVRAIEDSLIYDRFKKDSLYAVFQLDSLYKEFQQDSINLRKITKKINGGYNGWEQRYQLWLNAREVIEQYNNANK
ncbi:MAG: hypothetical protein FWF52_00110 [Candidatus Azobacteroides sp.]|nr:hypothetical protein [Candidatus Azobacteroides sp.]